MTRLKQTPEERLAKVRDWLHKYTSELSDYQQSRYRDQYHNFLAEQKYIREQFIGINPDRPVIGQPVDPKNINEHRGDIVNLIFKEGSELTLGQVRQGQLFINQFGSLCMKGDEDHDFLILCDPDGRPSGVFIHEEPADTLVLKIFPMLEKIEFKP